MASRQATAVGGLPKIAVVTMVTELWPSPTNVIPTMLMHDGFFVGHKFRYDGG